jgi:hypothetical protein
MSFPTRRTPGHLPRRLPVGATYVVEGFGGEEGQLRVIARYIVLPGGRRINVPAGASGAAAPRTLAFRRRANAKQSLPKSGASRGGKKYARRGTG